MKKRIFSIISVVVLFAIVMTVYSQSERNNQKPQQKKEQKDPPGQQQNKDKQGQKGQDKDNKGQSQGKGQQKDDRGNQGQGKSDMKDDKGKTDDAGKTVVVEGKDGYKWSRETFKDRKKYKDQEKVTLCHKFNRENEPNVTISVSRNALNAHMNHGDVMGECPAVSRGKFSDIFLRKRADYYNDLQNTHEQVLYSRSVLDYALERLADARAQLVVMQNSNVPVVEIERRQTVIVEVEREVSLLEALIGTAAAVVADRFL